MFWIFFWSSRLENVILQILMASISPPDGEKPPSIVTEQNLKLLFEIQKKVV